MVLVREIMHNEVYTTTKDESVLEATKKMALKGISCLVIKDENFKICGIITRRDIFEKVIAKNLDVNQTNIESVMTPNVKTAKYDADINEVIKIMNDNNIKQVPIMHEENIVGIVTQTDIVKNFNSLK